MKKIFTLLMVLFAGKIFAQPCTPNTNSINFNGTSDYVGMPSSPALNLSTAVSVEAWINPTSFASIPDQGTIICKHGWSAGEGGYVLRAGGSGQLAFNIGGMDTNGQTTSWHQIISAAGVISLNTWTHVAGTFDGDSLNIYVNGALVGTTLYSGGIYSSATYDLKIGKLSDNQPGQLRYWIGYIDEARVWNRKLSAGEINTNMNTQIDPLTQTGLVGYWRLNDGSGTNVTDLSGNNITGTLNGSGWSTNVPFSTGAPPAIITPSGNTTFCSGGSVNLTASAGAGLNYLWSSGATTQSINVTASGSYTVTVTDGNNCSGTSSPVTVTVNQGPPVPVITLNGTQLSVTSSAGIQWYLNGSTLFNQVGQNYTPAVNGSYTVVVTDNNGCTASSAPYVVNTIGIPEINGLTEFNVSYDPSNHLVLITTGLNSMLVADISVFDLQGRQVLIIPGQKLSAGREVTTIDFSRLQAGSYLVMLQSASGQAVRKFAVME
jgi:hypothetical protein